MELLHPIDAEIRHWLKEHVDNRSELSVAVGHSTSWLQKYVNGDGHATIDDLVRLAGLLLGLNLPALTGLQRQLLKACDGLDETDLQDLIAIAASRPKRRPHRAPSKGSNEQVARTPGATKNKARGRREA